MGQIQRVSALKAVSKGKVVVEFNGKRFEQDLMVDENSFDHIDDLRERKAALNDYVTIQVSNMAKYLLRQARMAKD